MVQNASLLRHATRFDRLVVGAASTGAICLSWLGHPTWWMSRGGADEFGVLVDMGSQRECLEGFG